MANWQKVTLTNKGAALLAKITARNLAFPLTRIAFGSGRPSNLNTATTLASPIDDAEIISKIQKDNTCTITFRFNNTKFTKAYDICEFGIFATDPDEGEILFAISTDSNPDHIQAASVSTVVTKTIVTGIGYNNSNNVMITLSNVSWITANEANDIAQNKVDEFAAKLYQINDTVQAVQDGETFPKKMNELANRLKAITGKSSWLTTPSITLEQALKSIDRSGDTLTMTTGNGSTTSFSIDNIASANSLNIINSQDLRFDANSTTATTIRVGYSADNYTGSGITEYDFYNWKGSLANVKASKFIGNLQGTADYANYATTMSNSDNSTRIATTAFVQSIKNALVNNAPSTLNTLGEIATSINNDEQFAKTVNNALALKAPLASPTLTGTPTAPTAASGTNTTQLATTAFVQTAVSPLATTAYVNSSIAPKADTTYVNTKTNDKYSNVTVSNATLTFTNGAGSTKAVTVNNVANANAASTATTATYANIINITRGNEIELNGSISGNGTELLIGYRANEGKQNITNYKFFNGMANGTLAQITAAQFNGNLKGNATTATTATYGVTQSTSDSSTKLATTSYVKNVISPYALTSYVDGKVAPKADTTYVNTKTNDKFSSVSASDNVLTFRNGAGSSVSATLGRAPKMFGKYTGSGGKQPPSYFGTESVGALMSNESVNGDSSYKNWLYMDNYGANDAGGATAIGVSRAAAKAFIMQSTSARSAWNNVAELMTNLGGTFTGNVFGPTPASGDNSRRLATTAFIQAIIANLRAKDILDFKQAAQAAAREQILGDVSNANSWWIGFPSSVGTFCIQGG
uniref:hypothetical protein n=1 Tax=uncultured Veillonella sp. TaxID=159268 RepID=UPI002593A896